MFNPCAAPSATRLFPVRLPPLDPSPSRNPALSVRPCLPAVPGSRPWRPRVPPGPSISDSPLLFSARLDFGRSPWGPVFIRDSTTLVRAATPGRYPPWTGLKENHRRLVGRQQDPGPPRRETAPGKSAVTSILLPSGFRARQARRTSRPGLTATPDGPSPHPPQQRLIQRWKIPPRTAPAPTTTWNRRPLPEPAHRAEPPGVTPRVLRLPRENLMPPSPQPPSLRFC